MASLSAYRRLMLKIASVLPERFRAAFLHPAGKILPNKNLFEKKKFVSKFIEQYDSRKNYLLGPTTVFFWAPTFKWGLVIAGIGDLNRPADTISVSQTAALMLTGAIWSRYSMVIIPKNYNLLSVNLFVCATGAYNCVRGLLYQIKQK
ncbi:mitochondrial pyruvate carrier 2-like isoform X1 [Monomorium pharaonis]|uniref:mitochondrial pyruvate carrier 2-like isoform X1 n=1 Tax=Monomorium pharaonis TaxID=307658 RepID=UPI00063F4681|nr:mitochondrial pyruvate carrier 2-like isoform X1 [Monomorium pharaonis]